MPQYEVEWTETRKFKARIMVPNDDAILEAARTPNTNGTPVLTSWLWLDTLPETNDLTAEVTAIGRVVLVQDEIDPKFPDIATSHEEVKPL